MISLMRVTSIYLHNQLSSYLLITKRYQCHVDGYITHEKQDKMYFHMLLLLLLLLLLL